MFLSIVFMLSACSVGNNTNKEMKQDDSGQSTGNNIINLDFSPVSIKELKQGNPKKIGKRLEA